MKTATINPVYWQIVSTMSPSDLRNAYFGSCNLTAEYLNDYSSDALNRFLGEWMDEHLPRSELSAVDLLEKPDYLLEHCASEFCSALGVAIGDQSDRAEWMLRHANTWFDAWGNFYVFAMGDSANCYIIRAENESEAFSELTTRFESAFSVPDDESEEYNDNGTAINTDYLVLIGCIVEGR